jgi:hypothetical protein
VTSLPGFFYLNVGLWPFYTDEEEIGGVGLETPHCSRTGFDEEESGGGGGGEESNGCDTDGGGVADAGNSSEAGSEHHQQLTKANNILSPMNSNLLSVDDIDADNLAADFDGSFTGRMI